MIEGVIVYKMRFYFMLKANGEILAKGRNMQSRE